MLLNLSKGKNPDITVSAQVRKNFPLDRLFELHKTVQIEAMRVLIEGFHNELQLNPAFDIARREDLISLVRKLNIYKLRVDILRKNVQ